MPPRKHRRRAEEEARAKIEEEENRRRAAEDARKRSEDEALRRKEEESRREVAERAGKAAAAKVAALAAAGKVSLPAEEEEEPGGRAAPRRSAGGQEAGAHPRATKCAGEPERSPSPGRSPAMRASACAAWLRCAGRRERERQRLHQGEQEQVKVVREVVIPETITVQELSNRMAERGVDVIKSLMRIGVMATINQVIDADTAELVVTEFGHRLRRVAEADVEVGLRGERGPR